MTPSMIAKAPTGVSPPLGFPSQINLARPDPVARPTPLPKRAKGRWFVGLILFGLCAAVGYEVWTTFFRYEAFGIVAGRVIEVSPPWDGAVQSFHVREGESVRQGQTLVTMDNLEMRQRVAQLADELTVAQANLEAESAKLKWQFAYSMDQTQGAVVAYYETLGNLLREQSKLDDLKVNLKRAEKLSAPMAISREEFDQIRFAKHGQEQRVNKLQEALDELKKRADQADSLMKKTGQLGAGMRENGTEQLKPSLARIAALQAEKTRLQERLEQGAVRAPCNGIVLKLKRFPGERCKVSEPLLTLLEESSLHVVMYLPQDGSRSIAVGDAMNLEVEPYPQQLPCQVTRLGDQFEPAPENIKRHYREGQKLLPVYLTPAEEYAPWMGLRIGGVVKLRKRWPIS